ncbi:glycosyltransferase 87 family protein [Propionibacterium sp.]|uniref:glycosyltransferase 87 family protein n=1 Tax=Propionibacterium sp. TaxID=1977903 RepID=UPI0039EAA922
MSSQSGTLAELKRPQWVVGFWLFSRAVMLCVFWSLASFIRNDVNYYAQSVLAHPWPIADDIRSVLVEYPTPVVWFMQLMGWFSGGSIDGYVSAFCFVIVVLDALACAALYRFESPLAAGLWALAGALLGPLMWFRFDLVPTLCVLGALYWVRRRPALAGVMIALGAGLKLWPALLIIPMLGISRPARRRGAGFVITGCVLVVVSVASQGLARTLSPLTFQSDRGLQIESVWATPLMLSRLWTSGDQTFVEFSNYQAYEIFAPSVHVWMGLAGVVMLLVIVFALLCCWWIGFGGAGLPGHGLPPEQEGQSQETAILLACTALVCGVMVADKTLSPQYLIWLFAPLAIVVARTIAHPVPGIPGAAGLRIGALGMATIGVTQLVYPLSYSGLIGRTDPNIGSTVLLAIRTSLIVALTAYSCHGAVKASLAVGRSTAAQYSSSLSTRAITWK